MSDSIENVRTSLDYYNKSIHTRMKYLAIEKNMSLRDIVNEAMKEYLEKHEK